MQGGLCEKARRRSGSYVVAIFRAAQRSQMTALGLLLAGVFDIY